MGYGGECGKKSQNRNGGVQTFLNLLLIGCMVEQNYEICDFQKRIEILHNEQIKSLIKVATFFPQFYVKTT